MSADTEIPLAWMPLFEWRKRHYAKQRAFTDALDDFWEIVFLAGNGCFGKGTSVMMFDGSLKNVEDVAVGDLLMGDDSTPRQVQRLARGKEPLYEFELCTKRTDGDKYIFNENHILVLVCTGEKGNDRLGEIKEVVVKDYLEWSDDKKRRHAFYKVPVEFYNRNDLLIDPYVLGAWLGDGDSSGQGFTSSDEVIVGHLRDWLETRDCYITESKFKQLYRYSIRGNRKSVNFFRFALQYYNLIKNKHIPNDYLTASKGDRLEILAGLIDTDGNLENEGSGYAITQKRKIIAEQIVYIARSVGLNANMQSCQKSCNYKSEKKTGVYWTVHIGRNVHTIPCRLKKAPDDAIRQREKLNFGVRNIVSLGEGEYYGFTLDGNHRFLGADFVVLRNTGKTNILYWTLITLCLGLHPCQAPDKGKKQYPGPPMRIKVLLNDFEHGYGKIFTDTVLRSQHLPDGTTIKPMALLDPYMVTSFPTKEDKTLTFYNKSIIFFQTSEQKKRQHSGTNFDILACDEEPEYSIYDESKRGLRTAKGGGKILHAFTPPFDEADKNKGPTWTKFKIIDPWQAGELADTQVIRAAMHENPAITPKFIEKFSRGKTEEQIRIQIYGEYPTWGQLVFPDFSDSLWQPKAKIGHLLPTSFEVPYKDHDCKFEMALDWHGSKPAAVIWTFEYMEGPNKGDVVVYDEISPNEGRAMTISELSHAIREHEGWTQKPIRRWGDPKMKDKNNALISGFSPWDEFNHCGIRLQEGWNREPYVGYSIINDFLRGKGQKNIEHPRLFIRENCKSLIFCMKNHYNVAHKDGTAEPDPKFSDYPVCLKYIMQNKSRKIKKNMDKQGQHSKWPLTSFGKHVVGRSYVDYSTWVPPMRKVG